MDGIESTKLNCSENLIKSDISSKQSKKKYFFLNLELECIQ